MKIDLDYMAEMLKVFLDSENAHINLADLKNSGLEVENGNSKLSEIFMFHVEIALDNQVIGTKSGPAYTLKDLGFSFATDGSYGAVLKPLRLTQVGHDLASSLSNKEVLQKLKSEFKDAPFKVIFDGGQSLLQHFFKKKLDSIIEN